MMEAAETSAETALVPARGKLPAILDPIVRLRRKLAGWITTADGEVSWPQDGPVTTKRWREGRGGWYQSPVYHKPTIISMCPSRPQAMIGDRSDQKITFSLGGCDDGTWYEGVVSQDDLFLALYNAGLLTARRKDDR